MQAIRIKDREQLVANQQLRWQLIEMEARKDEQKRKKMLHKLVAFLKRPSWDAI